MRDRKNAVLVLCDAEEEYAQLMTEFIKKRRELPWTVHTYTDAEEMLRGEGETETPISLLVVAEDSYQEKLAALRPLRTVILNESGLVRWTEFVNVNKYQPAENVLRELMEVYAEVAEICLPRLKCDSKVRFVGIYSPVRRCLQTTFALTMSQMTAEKHRTLYLNFEHYSGISELAADAQARDLADLLYFLTAEKEKFRLRFQTIIQHKGNLDYIPPMKSGQNLLTVGAGEWMQLIQRLEELGEYEYIIMDLSESMQGLFDILRLCAKIFTLTKGDRIAQNKVREYEEILRRCEYGDVLDKTCKCEAPQIHRVPDDLEQYTKGELADFVRRYIRELEGGGD